TPPTVTAPSRSGPRLADTATLTDPSPRPEAGATAAQDIWLAAVQPQAGLVRIVTVTFPPAGATELVAGAAANWQAAASLQAATWRSPTVMADWRGDGSPFAWTR